MSLKSFGSFHGLSLECFSFPPKNYLGFGLCGFLYLHNCQQLIAPKRKEQESLESPRSLIREAAESKSLCGESDLFVGTIVK